MLILVIANGGVAQLFGDGRFEKAQTLDLGNLPASLVLVDIDGDGDLDLLRAAEAAKPGRRIFLSSST